MSSPGLQIEVIAADWPAPDNVRAMSTTRVGGGSKGSFAGLNLATHVGDDADNVQQNRILLRQQCQLPAEPAWLEQCHSTTVVPAKNAMQQADASISSDQDAICAVLTADCLPILLCDVAGTQVAAVHAGWKGLCAGIISKTIVAFDCEPEHIMAWLGPAIGPQTFEVGQDVVTAFTARHNKYAAAFVPTDELHWLCDIYQLARIELHDLAVAEIYGGGLCTFADTERFYSYRRDNQTGRMANLIWLAR